MVRVSSSIDQTQSAHPETIESQITAYYYAALTNVLCQAHMPRLAQGEEYNDPVKALVEASYKDFQAIDNWLGALDVNQIRANPSAPLFREVQETWRHHVKDWRMISRGKTETPTSNPQQKALSKRFSIDE